MDSVLSVINGITNAVSSSGQASAARTVANAESRTSNTMYRMLPLIILAAVVLLIVITKK